jgi:hypothetical protein
MLHFDPRTATPRREKLEPILARINTLNFFTDPRHANPWMERLLPVLKN